MPVFPDHVLRVDQFTRPVLDDLLSMTGQVRRDPAAEYRLRGRILATLFYEPSTRTRMSFESAMLRLGGQVISAEAAADTSSATKGETLEDTARMISSYADAIVMRHPVAGAAEHLAAASNVPVINAGDGPREHPTQALLDIYTIHHELGRIDDLTVTLAGDLLYGRAPRSLAMLLGLTRNTRVILCAPDALGMAPDVLARLSEQGVAYEVEPDLLKAASRSNVVYMTRIQKERFPSAEAYNAVRGSYVLGMEHVEVMPEKGIIMHPLPRVDEIDYAVDASPRAAYFRQAKNGVYVRMAILDRLLRHRRVG